jgi:hypothetical protein
LSPKQCSNDTLLDDASKYTRKALEINKQYNISIGGLHRTITLAGICYTHRDLAITTEGLFQSAFDGSSFSTNTNSTTSKSIIPMDECLINSSKRIEHRDALLALSNLCCQWDEREKQRLLLLNQAQEFDEAIQPLIIVRTVINTFFFMV